MAEKPDNKKEAAAPAAEKAGKKAPIWTKLPVVVGGVMVLEAAVLLGVFKFMGASAAKSASAAEIELKGAKEHGEGGHDEGGGGHEGGEGGTAATQKGGTAELAIIPTFRAPNTRTGKRLIFDVCILATVKSENKDKLDGLIKARGQTIQDRVRTIIAQAEPTKLDGTDEPGLETLKRQVKYQLEEIVGEGLVEEVLIPRCIPFRGD